MGYTAIDNSKTAVQLAWANGALYRRDQDGSIWRWDYTYPYNQRWSSVSGPDNLTAIAGTKDFLYKLHTDGKLFRFLGHQNEWLQVHDYGHIRDAIVSDDSYYYILGDGRVAVDGMMHPLQSYAQLEKLYKGLQAQDQQDKTEISRLQNAKAEVERTVQQLKATLAQAEKKEQDLQCKVLGLEKSLTTAQAAEAKLASELDAEKKKEYNAWKKAQEHDAQDHKALEQAHTLNIALEKKLDGLNKDILGTIIPGLLKTIEGLQTGIGEQQALVDVLKKHQE
ncbi:hypothetical protein QQX98_008180 [Neonectria punicea]|uniref:Peptidase S74 domain-containing protein n=1 Tax=Neonectria punicea TaxID=979145 RepID=A0ABR1GW05_9HYPO